MIHRFTLLTLFVCLCLSSAPSLVAQNPGGSIPAEDEFKPNPKSVTSLNLPFIEGEIVIDGNLDDEGWRTAALADNFCESYPGDCTKPKNDMWVRVGYDDENLYVSFQLKDDPNEIRSTLSERDAIWQDDYFGIILDTFGNSEWAYFLATNPLGIQGDTRIINGGNEDDSFTVIFKSAGMVTEDGYQVELAFPFRSLRFPAGSVQDWKINFWVTQPRGDRNRYTWFPQDRDNSCFICQLGEIKGIKGISESRNLQFLPALTGLQGSSLKNSENPTEGLEHGKLTAEPSLGVKYGINRNLTMDLALNPDFSQIEADPSQVDVNTTFALFFDERRPFFQEGSDLFDTEISTVYTRSINNPTVAAKLTGRYDNYSLGYIGGRDQVSPYNIPFAENSAVFSGGASFSNIFRLKRAFGKGNYIGGLMTDRRMDAGGSGTTFGVDGAKRLTETFNLKFQFVGSNTIEPDSPELSQNIREQTFGNGYTSAFDGESFNGSAAAIGLERFGRHWVMVTQAEASSPTFRAENGFESKNSIYESFTFQQYVFYPKTDWITRISPNIVAGLDADWDRQWKDRFVAVGIQGTLKGQTQFNLRTNVINDERFAGSTLKGVRSTNLFINSNFSQFMTIGGGGNVGESISRNLDNPTVGNSKFFNVFSTMKPNSQLKIRPSLVYNSLHEKSGEEIFSGYIFRSRFDYQATKNLSVRLIAEYNKFSDSFALDPLITYRLNAFSALYFGSTLDYLNYNEPYGLSQTDRQIFFKLQYLFQG